MISIFTETPDRFVLFPIKRPDVWNAAQIQLESFWTRNEIDFSSDIYDWEHKLNDGERYFISHVLGFFATADGIVNENLVQHFQKVVKDPEVLYFYGFQNAMELIHSEVYSLMIDTYIKDETEKSKLFGAIQNIPCIQKKAQWALKWIESDTATFGDRLVAFACVEGIFFSGSFAAIYYLKKQNKLKGLCKANDFIARDEGLHQQFACLLYRFHLLPNEKISDSKLLYIVREAVELECEFQTKALPVSLLGINAEQMTIYIKFVADRLLVMLGLPKYYNAQNPFPWITNISLMPKENFFEEPVSQYAKLKATSVVQEKKFDLDIDF